MAECAKTNPGERDFRIRQLFAQYWSPDPETSQRAKEDLIAENGGLINFLIDKSYSSYKAKHQEDLFQVGAYGMLLSFRTFDPDKGTFSTHAAHYIEHELHDYITTFVNGIKPHFATYIKKVRRAKEILSVQGNESPTPTDIAIESGLSVAEVKRALDVIEKSQMISAESDEARDAMLSTRTPGPSEVYAEKEMMEVLYRSLKDLPYDEMIAICMKYRLGPFGNRGVITHQDIADEIGTAVSNVKGILASGIRKLRRNKSLATMLLGNTDKKKDRTSDVSVVPIAGSIRELEYLAENEDEGEHLLSGESAKEFFKDCDVSYFGSNG